MAGGLQSYSETVQQNIINCTGPTYQQQESIFSSHKSYVGKKKEKTQRENGEAVWGRFKEKWR